MEDVVRYVLIHLEATTVPATVDMNLLDKIAMVPKLDDAVIYYHYTHSRYQWMPQWHSSLWTQLLQY